MHPPTAAAIVLAGGSGIRLGGDRNKVYLPLAGRSVISWSLTAFAGMPDVGPLVLVVRAADRELVAGVLEREVDAPVEVVTGGATRQESELAGLRHLAARIEDGSVDAVLVHDGARPLVGPDLAARVLRAARAVGGAVPGVPRDDLAAATPDGQGLVAPAAGLVAVQTPQGFRARSLLAAYERASREAGSGATDTAGCMQRHAPDVAVTWVPGDERNIKITVAHDLVVAERVLAASGHRLG